ncbi:hypothetical protein M8C21_028508, partial [Ambrosia artemisiifolia]
MAMAALRREGRRLAPLVSSPNPIHAIRSTLAPTEEQVGLGVRSISTQIVRNRMKSVRNIQKITKAMKMVAASKLRAIQVRAENSRGLWQPFTALLGDTPSPDTECKYVILGEKGKAQLIRDSKKDIELIMTELQKNFLNYTQVSVLADDILKNVEFDALRIVFNKFQSVVSFLPTTATVLSPEIVERESEAGGKIGDLDSYEIEGGETKSEVLQNLAEFQFSCVMFNAVLENACSEQGARMSAMDSSSRNAGDMLDRLTLTYNRTRQASITTELIEIISGASALEEVKEQVGLGVRSISTQIVRNRMKSVRNIQKITKAMKMVAASKLRAIQVRAENSRGLWQPFTALLGDTPSPDTECKYVILGEKGKAQLIRDSKKDIELIMTELQKNFLNYTQVSVLADDILKNVEFDALRIVFNKFQSVVSFLPTTATVLSPEIVERESEAGGKIGDLDSYEIEGGETKSEVLQNLAEFQFSCVMFNAVLENACSEQGARMSAMDSSSRNAGDMLDLKLIEAFSLSFVML